MLAKDYLRANEIERFADPEKLKDVSWLWLNDLNRISPKNYKSFLRTLFLMMQLDRQYYYSLEGLPAKVEALLIKGKNLARKISYGQGNHLICRISRLVGSYFVLLLTLPFTLMGTIVNRIFREKSIKLFKREFDLWNTIFYPWQGSHPSSYQGLRTGAKELIIQLIQNRKRATDCPFRHILLHLGNRTGTINLFYGDGTAPGLKTCIQNEEKCLVIFSPMKGEEQSYKNFSK
ncbi:MAG: hypothetical protein HWD61_08305 [Parachlamydiaceae bacterium]|nr:MAG: hypothetical protein HWD61_08305 [Parachlamydiaceae bacterium]